MKLITISGVDGSGKSTQLNLLKNYLESENKKVFYFHAIKFSLATKLSEFKKKYCLFCRLTGRCQTQPLRQSVTKANLFQIQLRKIFLFVDIWRFKRLRQKLKKGGFDYILSDRYFYDTVINILYLMKKRSSVKAEKWIPAPDLAVYLKINPEKIMQRERKPDQGFSYLLKKMELFKEKKTAWNLQSISADRPKEEIFLQLQEKIASIQK